MKIYMLMLLFLSSLALNAAEPVCEKSSSSKPSLEVGDLSNNDDLQQLINTTKRQLMDEYKKISEFREGIIESYSIENANKSSDMNRVITQYENELQSAIIYLSENDFESALIFLSGLYMKFPDFEDLKEPVQNLEKIIKLQNMSSNN